LVKRTQLENEDCILYIQRKMPRGGGAGAGRGAKKNYKGQRRHFTDEDELKNQAEKNEREKEWRRQRGIESDEEEEEGADKSKEADAARDAERARNRDMPPSDSSSEYESSDEEEAKPKGVNHLIEISNPNRNIKQAKKVGEMGATVGLSRREREEIEKQEAKRRYQELHAAGKTDEAQADLARLAIIRKQREEAAKKKAEEAKAKEAAKSKGKS